MIGGIPLQRVLPSAGALSPTETSASVLAGQAGAPSFGELLQGAIQSTSTTENKAQQAISQALAGDDVTEIEVLSAVKKADLSLRMMLQVRNSLLQAYDEVKQMQF